MADINQKPSTIWLVQFPDGAKSFLDSEPPEYMKGYATAYAASPAPASAQDGQGGLLAGSGIPQVPQHVVEAFDRWRNECNRVSDEADPVTAARNTAFNAVGDLFAILARQTAPRPAHETIVQDGDELVCTACGNTAPTVGSVPHGTSATCPDCNGTGMADSGGTHPWGEPAMIPCGCEQFEPLRDGVSIGLIMQFVELAKNLPDISTIGPIPLTPIQIAFVAGKLAQAVAAMDDAPQEQAASRAAVPEGWRDAIEKAAWILESYHGYLKKLSPINFDEHPYIPEIEGTAKDLRAMLAAAPAAQEGKAVDGTPTGDTVKHIISGVREFYLGLLSRHLPSEAFDLARSADSTYSVYLGVADHFRELLTAQQTISQVDAPEGGAK